MPKAVGKAPWFAYFPDDYRWSAAMSISCSTSYWGGTVMGELDRIGRRLKGKEGNDAAWLAEWARMGDHVRGLGLEAEKAGNRLTAAAFHKRASMYYQIGERFPVPKDKKALAIYKKSVDSFRRFARLTDRPRIETVEVPFEKGKKLPALLVHAENTKQKRPPVVAVFDGFDISKEIQYLEGAEEFARRGMSVLLVDGPGNGESIRFRKVFMRHDYEAAGSAALDYLETRRDVDARRAGIMAISLGGYFAPRSASMDRRFKACVAWGAIWDYHATWKKRIEAAYKVPLSVPGHHLTWSMNTKTVEEALRKLEPFRLDGVVQKMRCPFLLVHGEDDQQVPLPAARSLFKAVGSRDKTFKIFTAKEGGAQHCQIDNIPLGVCLIADWLKEKLRA